VTSILWLVALVGPALAVAALGRTRLSVDALRTASLLAAALVVALAALVALVPELGGVLLKWPEGWPTIFGASALRMDELSATLVGLPAILWLITIGATPNARLDRQALELAALGTATTTAAFLTESPLLLALAWIARTVLFLRALDGPGARAARRNCGWYLWASSTLFVAGIVSIYLFEAADVGLGLLVAAILIRKGIMPFHAWIPNAFDRGRIGPTVLFCAPQLGTYAAAVLIVPQASAEILRAVAVLSLVTAVYGSVLAFIQHDARRAAGYIFVSQSSLVLAGLDSTTTEALAGSLVLWLSSALAFTGMARTVQSLEARRGRLDLRKHHGGYEQMPLLASGFLVLSLACTGFPGTLGFVGEEMLLDGAIQDFPVLGLMVVAASAFTGLAVLRMYFSLFCGRSGSGARFPMRRQEAIAIGAVAAFLIAAGMFPRPLIASRHRAAQSVLAERAPHSP